MFFFTSLQITILIHSNGVHYRQINTPADQICTAIALHRKLFSTLFEDKRTESFLIKRLFLMTFTHQCTIIAPIQHFHLGECILSRAVQFIISFCIKEQHFSITQKRPIIVFTCTINCARYSRKFSETRAKICAISRLVCFLIRLDAFIWCFFTDSNTKYKLQFLNCKNQDNGVGFPR